MKQGIARSAAPSDLRAARSFCYRLARTHIEQYSVLILLVPRRLVAPIQAVYAWCRWTDDLAPRAEPGAALNRLRDWRDELGRCFDGRPRHPITIALRETIRTFDLPRQPFLDRLFAVEQDQLVTRYATFAQLRDYCRRAAEPIGRIGLRLAGATSPRAAALADSLCMGLYLAHLCRDVGHDLAAGRVYMPDQDRHHFGYGDEELLSRRFTPAFAQLMRYETARARDFLLRGLPLVDHVPADLQPLVELIARGGLAVLDRIEGDGYDVLSGRPTLSFLDQVRLLAASLPGWRRLAEACRSNAWATLHPPNAVRVSAGLPRTLER